MFSLNEPKECSAEIGLNRKKNGFGGIEPSGLNQGF